LPADAVVLAADVQDGPTDMAAFVAGLDHESYSFLAALRSANRDLVLLGYSDGKAGLVRNARAVTECVFRTIRERTGDAPLTLGGLGRGGSSRPATASSAWNARGSTTKPRPTSPTTARPRPRTRLRSWTAWAGWPMRPRKLKAVSGEFKDELNDHDFDDNKVGAPKSGGALITRELGSWIIDNLS